MKIQVVTTLNKKLYNSYAKRFFETYNWPFDLTVYSEDMLDIPNYDTIVRSIYDEVPSCEEFVQRNKNRIALTDFKKKGLEFLKDGVRFCYKVYSYTDQLINNEDYDGVIGIDIDSIFYKPIDAEWVKKHLHRDDCMMSYLGRGNT